MKKLLQYYYNFNTDILIKRKNNIFEYKNNIYLIDKINKIDINIIKETQKYNFFFKIVPNRYNLNITEYNKEKYVLLRIEIKNNRVICLNDIFFISSLNIIINIEKNNYNELWKRKIDYFEDYLLYNNKLNEDINWNYYIGIAENAINYCKNINYNEIKYGIVYNRFYNIKTLYDLLNPINTQYGPVANSISEYIKYLFFCEGKEINILDLLKINLSFMDYKLLISRLLFPTYFFDIFKDNLNYNKYKIIESKTNNYIKYVKRIIMTIKKRHNNMPLIEWINN